MAGKILAEKNEIRNYIFQFLMVFLGITAGFFVENIRENYSESKRAQEYASSLLSDLQEDTLNLRRAIKVSEITSRAIDTLVTLIDPDNINKVPGGKIYYYGALALRYQNFVPNQATINQLISTGSLQYFKSYSIQQAIGEYNQLLKVLNYQQETENQTYPEKVKFIEKLFDGNILSRVLYVDLKQDFIDSFINKDYRLPTYDKREWKEFANFCEFRRQFLLTKADDMYPRPLKSAVKLINKIKEEY